MEILRNANINFVGGMRVAFFISVLLILAGIGSLIADGGPQLSIDFTGGTMLQVTIGENGFLITFPSVREEGEAYAVDEMQDVLRAGFPAASVIAEREESVGPKIGGELRTAAMNSVALALVLIVLYITVRFIFRYGIAAILALVHDVTITLGVFSLLDKEISLSIIAAFLTIIGYSLNDTIVVFDRIRENMRLRRKESYRQVINRSINECLSRTVLTSATTFFVAGALYVLGGAVIHDFAFALCFGVVIGTYSSIFIASPILVWWTERRIIDRKRAAPSM